MLKNNKFQDNKTLSDFIAYANKNFTKKKQAMKILENLSQLNDEGIKIKRSGEHKEQEEEDNKKQNNKKKTLVISTRAKDEEKLSQLSLIKADSSEDYLESNQNKNELEISIVGPEKLKKKKKMFPKLQN